jgi:flagellar basal body-associated protein FliL
MSDEELSTEVTQEEGSKGSNVRLIIIIVVLFVLCFCSVFVVTYLFGPAIGNLYNEIIRSI